MYKHLFLNPFYWYSLVWSIILLSSLYSFSLAYGTINAGVILFFVITIVLSGVAGFFYAKHLKKIDFEYHPPKHMWICVAIIGVVFIADFIYAGSIPLWNELTNSEQTYKDFKCIPYVHDFIFTFSFYYAVNMFYHFLKEKNLKKRLTYIGIMAGICLFFLGLYNRAALMMLAFICAVLFLSYRKKIKWWHIVTVLLFAIVGLYLFGIMGNIRSGDAWYDSTYIFNVAQIEETRWPKFIPTPFAWAWVYMATPLGNLSNFVQNYAVSWSLPGMLSCILPNILTVKIFPDISFTIPPVIEYLTVSSGFATAYMYGGYWGMIFLFAYGLFFVWAIFKLSLLCPNSFVQVASVVACIFAFLFFDNFFSYSGITFALIYPLAPVAVLIWRKCKKAIDKKKEKAETDVSSK